MKYGIDYLLSQIISFYRQFYVPPTDSPPDPTLSVQTLSPPPLPLSSPPPLMATSPSYSSFYSYTRTMSQGDLTTIVDPFDSIPVRTSYSPIATPKISSPSLSQSQSQSRWSWLLSLFSRAAIQPFLALLSILGLSLLQRFRHSYLLCCADYRYTCMPYIADVYLETASTTGICCSCIGCDWPLHRSRTLCGSSSLVLF